MTPDSSPRTTQPQRLLQQVEALRQRHRATQARSISPAREETGGDHVILALHGEVSLAAMPTLASLLHAVVSTGDEILTVDLSDASSVSAGALEVINGWEDAVGQLRIERRPIGPSARDKGRSPSAPVQCRTRRVALSAELVGSPSR